MQALQVVVSPSSRAIHNAVDSICGSSAN
jgi:hypothetical protein